MTGLTADSSLDVAVIGAGAAGLATAIFARRLNPALRVAIFDGARRPGAKILVSGGSRCNVTNVVVTAADFNGRPTPIRRVLNALPVPATVAFFDEIGVRLKEEAGGKLFPTTDRARDVLDALLRELARAGATLRAGERVTDVSRAGDHFRVTTSEGRYHAGRVVLATGGLSLPKTGSDGFGYTVAGTFGHAIVPTTPALVPLRLGEGRDDAVHRALSGVAQPVQLALRVDGRITTRIDGALLWTHFGVSGPVVLDVSRHWLRAALAGRPRALEVNMCPGHDHPALDAWWVDLARTRPRLSSLAALSLRLPASVAAAVLGSAGVPHDLTLADLSRERRRHLVRALLEWPLAVTGSRGYDFAEVTAGGVDLMEVSPASMESRKCAGLFLVGEVLDVDGRIGGFNFQWAWSSAHAAAVALAQGAQPAG